MTDWREVKISELGRIVTGRTPSSSNPEMFEGNIPFLTPTDIDGTGRHVTTGRQVSADWDTSRKMFLPEGSVCVVCIGATIGKVCMTSKESCTNQQINSIVVDRERFDPFYIYYVMRTLGSVFKANASGSATPIINKTTFAQVTVSLPELRYQSEAARLLRAYDDLIEVNHRRIALLESMTRELFEEWFVRFRFQGHDATAIARTAGDALPEGWVCATVGEAAAYINRGIAPKYDEGANTIVINQKCVRDGRLTLTAARRQSRQPVSDKLIRAGDVLINSTGVGTLGRVAQVEQVPVGATVDSHITIVRANSAIDLDYLGLALLGMQSALEAEGTGSTGQTELSRHRVAAQPVILPPAKLQEQFGRTVRPARRLAYELGIANQQLAAARDLLIPRLLSGRLTLRAAERELAEAA